MSDLAEKFRSAGCVVFYPQTASEAAAIQQRLFDAGIHWSTGMPEVKHVRRILRDGMTVAGGQIFFGVVDDEPRVVATLADFAPAPKKRGR